MNIAQAKEEIVNTLRAYQKKDENGMYLFPSVRQRPVLLMGPPGIGKTAIIAQAAQECSCGMVSYTMTHHTRQSAVGLPHIVSREYDGETVTVTEYTMSEIIASVRDCMKKTGCREGILFIDEINCVSETLTPVMLQLLQNKTFGTHQVPEGWIIAAAGNPPKYNRSAKEFDIVTMDRVRRIDIEPDLDCWMDYAENSHVHEAVLSFLRIRPDCFYEAVSDAQGISFVTARGWEDLSSLLIGYELIGASIGEQQIRQYLGNDRTASAFAAYYRLYRRYGEDYGIDRILNGQISENEYEQRISMVGRASFEERYTVTGLLLDSLKNSYAIYDRARTEEELFDRTTQQFYGSGQNLQDFLTCQYAVLETKKKNGLVSPMEEKDIRTSLRFLSQVREQLLQLHGLDSQSDLCRSLLKEVSKGRKQAVTEAADRAGEMTDRAFAFCEEAFPDGQEMLLLTSGIARNQQAMRFISDCTSESFLHWSAQLI